MSGAAAQTQDTPNQPQFFSTPAAISKEKHASSGIKQENGFSFAADVAAIPLTLMEVVEASRTYPIVIAGEPGQICAITGLREKNLFVDSKGQWDPLSYIPLGVRKYPFTFAGMNDEQFALCVDESAPHFMAKDADIRFFDDNGETTEMTKRALEMCQTYAKHMKLSANFCEAISTHNLAEVKQAQVSTPNGTTLTVEGFRMINEPAFNKLSASAKKEFDDNHWSGLLYLIIASQVNWKYLAMRNEA